MRIDLHTHSRVSDGTDDPATLVHAAVQAGLDVLGLTDHDTTAGWAQARTAAEPLPVRLVLGIEVSTRWRDRDVHLLALWPDEHDPELQAMLAEIRRSRDARLPQVLARLAASGVPVTSAEVQRAANGSPSIGRPHIADAMVAAGHVGDRAEAFDRWLGEGRPGHVSKHAPELPLAVEVVRRAGGVPVLAHPWSRSSRDVLGEAALAGLAEKGLVGLEVDHVDHDEATRRTLRGIARSVGLVVTGSSDYHGTGKAGVALGAHTTDPAAFAALEQARAGGR
jgi:predicted metal-dependent phosphoesterase TrpH